MSVRVGMHVSVSMSVCMCMFRVRLRVCASGSGSACISDIICMCEHVGMCIVHECIFLHLVQRNAMDKDTLLTTMTACNSYMHSHLYSYDQLTSLLYQWIVLLCDK